MTPPWQDERIPLLKSAVQKCCRRGETSLAYAAAARLLALPGGRSALARRLPVIAAEDVGWWWIPAASIACDGPLADAELLRAVAGLSSLPKSKDAFYLADTVWEGRMTVGAVSVEALRRALAGGDHRTALALALVARDQRQWRSGDRLVRVLSEVIAGGPDFARQIGECALRREARGGSGMDELIAAAVIAAIDRPDGELQRLPRVTPPSPVRLHIEWWMADGHTVPGRRALRRVAVRRGIPYRLLAELQFSFESVRLGPTEIPSRWRAQAVAMDATAYGWQTHERGMELWEALRVEVSAEIEHELRGLRQ
jgi:hypothetical protein